MAQLFDIAKLDEISTFEDDKYCLFVKNKLKLKLEQICVLKNKSSSRLLWTLKKLLSEEKLKYMEKLIVTIDESLEILKVTEEIQKSAVKKTADLIDNSFVDERTLNEIVILEAAASKLIMKSCKEDKTIVTKLLKTLHQTSFRHSLSLKLETMILNKFHKEGCSIEESLAVAGYRNAFELTVPILLAFNLVGIENSKEIDLILENIAQLQQVVEEWTDDEIELEKTSWIVAKMLQFATPEQKKNILKTFASKETSSGAIRKKLNFINLEKEFAVFHKELYIRVNNQIGNIQNQEVRSIFNSLVAEIIENVKGDKNEVCEFSMQ